MKKSVLILFTLLFLKLTYSQNLIPNGDFELGPNQSAEGWATTVAGPNSWIAIAGTSPDRIYLGDALPSRDNDTAQSGMAYVEFYGKDTIMGVEAEIGQATLLSSLQVGQKYKLRFHLDIDDFFYNGAAGIAFRFNGGDSISSVLQVNTGKWESYDTTFIATAISTQIELVGIGGPSLVKIDNIFLEIDTTVGVIENIVNQEEFNIYPNPFSNLLNIESLFFNDLNSIESIFLYDIFGNRYNTDYQIIPNKVILKKGNLSNGYYFIKIVLNNKIITKKILIN